jgi:hypothetical protein
MEPLNRMIAACRPFLLEEKLDREMIFLDEYAEIIS